MPSPDGSTSWRLLGAGGSPSRTPFKKRAGWSTFESPLPTSQRCCITRFERWRIAVPAVFLRSWDQKRGHFRAVHAENEQQPGGNYKNGIRVLSSGNHRRGKRPRINNPPRGDPRRPARRLRRSFSRLQAQVDQRTRAKRTWGLHQSSGATSGALYVGGESSTKLSTAFWISARFMFVWSGSKGWGSRPQISPQTKARWSSVHLNLSDSDDS